MRMRKSVLTIGLLLIVLLLSGCMHVNQEIRIDPNGRTGSFSLDIALAETVISMAGVDLGPLNQFQDLFEMYATNPFVDSIESETYSEGGFSHFALSADLSDVESFLSSTDSLSAAGISINFADQEDGSVQFTQTINLAASQDSLGITQFALGLIGSAFEDQFWNLKLYVPNASETNGNWNEEGMYVEWNVPMQDIVSGNEPVLLTATYTPKPPVNPVMWILLILLVIIAAGIIVYFVLRNRKAESVGLDSSLSDSNSSDDRTS